MLLMQLNRAPYQSIVEVRNAVEPMISQLAAKHMTDEQLAELAATIEAMRGDLDDRDLFLDSNKRFHDIIAWSSGNVLFAYIVDVAARHPGRHGHRHRLPAAPADRHPQGARGDLRRPRAAATRSRRRSGCGREAGVVLDRGLGRLDLLARRRHHGHPSARSCGR